MFQLAIKKPLTETNLNKINDSLTKFYQKDIKLEALKEEIGIPQTDYRFEFRVDSPYNLSMLYYIKEFISPQEYFIYLILKYYLKEELRSSILNYWSSLCCYVELMKSKMLFGLEFFSGIDLEEGEDFYKEFYPNGYEF